MKKKLKNIVVSNFYLTRLSFSLYRGYLRITSDHTIGRNAMIGPSCILRGKNLFGERSSFTGSEIGYGSYISHFSEIKNSKIGKYCSIGPRVMTIHGSHPSSKFVSTHPSFFSPEKRQGFTYVDNQRYNEHPEKLIKGEAYTTLIGNDVWIGADVKILEGVKIGDGAIIAAGAMVIKDILPYTVVGGVPAKFIKARFSDVEISFLNNLKWWNKSTQWIKQNASLFNNIKKLKKQHSENGD
jgi:acetyltransferase-like isoleucine patch superfamily enzyme